jgi:D-alanine-D-alanine ligase
MTNAPQCALVLHEAIDAGARPDEVDALAQMEHVSAALRELGWPVAVLPTGLNLAVTQHEISRLAPAFVFNLVEALGGDGRMIHLVPSLLQSSQVPFTGSGSDALFLSSQKLLAKRWMHAHGIPTPPDFVAGDERVDDKSSWIVKSVWEHASFGMDDGCVVNSVPAARKRIDACAALHGGEWFAEAFVDGREFNVSLLEVSGRPEVLPIAEMTFVDYPRGKPKIVGYAAKWDATAPEYHATQRVFAELPATELAALRNVALQCWEVFELRGYARVDIRMDAAGTPWVLEVNSNPCLTPDAGFFAAVTASGRTYTQLIELITAATLS